MQKQLVGVRDLFFKETEEKYMALCEEVLEAEEEDRKLPPQKMMKLERVLTKLDFPEFGRDVLDWLFHEALIFAQPVIGHTKIRSFV